MRTGSWRRKRKFDGSMGGTAAAAANTVLGRQINAHLRNARVYVRVHVYFGDYRQLTLPVCYCINPLPRVRLRSRLSRRRYPRVASSARSNPIIRVLRFVRSNSVCLIIRTIRLFPTRAAVCFNTACLCACTRARARVL